MSSLHRYISLPIVSLAFLCAGASWASDACTRFGSRLAKVLSDPNAECTLVPQSRADVAGMLVSSSSLGLELGLGYGTHESAALLIELQGQRLGDALASPVVSEPTLGKYGYTILFGRSGIPPQQAYLGAHGENHFLQLSIRSKSLGGKVGLVSFESIAAAREFLRFAVKDLEASSAGKP